MTARLLSRFGAFEGLDCEIGDEATVGRSSDNAVALDTGSVSKRHARIAWDAESGAYWLEDLDSLNGTWVDGLRVRGKERLAHLNVVSFGGSGDLIFQDLDLCAQRSQAEGAQSTSAVDEREVRERVSAADSDLRDVSEVKGGSETADLDRTQIDLEVPVLARGRFDRSPSEQEPDETEEEPVVPSLPKFAARSGEAKAAPVDPRPGTVGQGAASGAADSGAPIDHTQHEPLAVSLPTFLRPSERASKLSDPPALDVSAVLEVKIGEDPVGRFELGPGIHVLGRGVGCDVQVASEHLSRRHAAFRVSEGHVYVRDLSSKNGTLLAGAPIEDEIEIEPGVEVLLGNVRTWWRR